MKTNYASNNEEQYSEDFDNPLSIFNGNAVVSKMKRYNWVNPIIPAKFKLIDKKLLKIDRNYQRGEVSTGKVNKIVRKWDWVLFGTLSVAKRNNGSYYVYDGGNRLRAAWKRSDIKYLPCMVFESINPKQESKAFREKNSFQSNVSSVSKFKALVFEENIDALRCKSIFENRGYYLKDYNTRGNGKYSFGCINTFFKMTKTDYETAKKCFNICADIAVDGENISKQILDGLFLLERKAVNTIFTKPNIERMRKSGLEVIDVIIRRHVSITGKGGAIVCMDALLKYFNKGRKHKIKLKID